MRGDESEGGLTRSNCWRKEKRKIQYSVEAKRGGTVGKGFFIFNPLLLKKNLTLFNNRTDNVF